MAAFQTQAGRVEAGAARAFANVATLIEKTESERSGRLSQLHDRLADIEAQIHKKDFRIAPENPDIRRKAAPVRDPLAGAECKDPFSTLEQRLKTLMERLEGPSPRVAAPVTARRLDDAVSAIEAGRRVLDANVEAPKPVRPPLAALIEDGFEAAGQKLDRAKNPEDDKRLDRLQQGVDGLAGRLEKLHRAFPAAAFHELADRIEAALTDSGAESATAPAAGLAELEMLRGELAAMGRALADVAPRASVAGLEDAVRELGARIEMTRDAALRAAEARGETASSAEIEALAGQVAAMSRALDNVAPRSQLASLESSLRALGENLQRSRNDGLREAVLAPTQLLARDLRGELAQALAEVLPEVMPGVMAEFAAPADLDVVASELRQIQGKLEDLLRAGWATAKISSKVQDKSDELRATIAAAVEHFAPIAGSSNKWRRCPTVWRRWSIARTKPAAPKSGSGGRTGAKRRSLARRRDAAGRYLRADWDAGGEAPGMRTPPTLEPLLRALAEKLDLAAAPQPDSRVLEALERQMAQVSEQLSETIGPLSEQQEFRHFSLRGEAGAGDRGSRQPFRTVAPE